MGLKGDVLEAGVTSVVLGVLGGKSIDAGESLVRATVWAPFGIDGSGDCHGDSGGELWHDLDVLGRHLFTGHLVGVDDGKVSRGGTARRVDKVCVSVALV